MPNAMRAGSFDVSQAIDFMSRDDVAKEDEVDDYMTSDVTSLYKTMLKEEFGGCTILVHQRRKVSFPL